MKRADRNSKQTQSRLEQSDLPFVWQNECMHLKKEKPLLDLYAENLKKNFILGGHAVPPSKPLDFTDFLP